MSWTWICSTNSQLAFFAPFCWRLIIAVLAHLAHFSCRVIIVFLSSVLSSCLCNRITFSFHFLGLFGSFDRNTIEPIVSYCVRCMFSIVGVPVVFKYPFLAFAWYISYRLPDRLLPPGVVLPSMTDMFNDDDSSGRSVK